MVLVACFGNGVKNKLLDCKACVRRFVHPWIGALLTDKINVLRNDCNEMVANGVTHAIVVPGAIQL